MPTKRGEDWVCDPKIAKEIDEKLRGIIDRLQRESLALSNELVCRLIYEEKETIYTRGG